MKLCSIDTSRIDSEKMYIFLSVSAKQFNHATQDK